MKFLARSVFIFSLCSFCLFSFLKVTAITNESRPFETLYLEIGYQNIGDALYELEQHYNQRLKLPYKLPPISFTHSFGRFNKYEDGINNSFEVEYLNEKLTNHHYTVWVRPIKHKIPIREKYVVKTFDLKNGENATYSNRSGFNTLVFEQDNWQYMLRVDQSISDIVTPEVLVEIANSIE